MAIDHSSRTIEFLSSNYSKYCENLQLQTCDFCEPGLSLGKIFDAVYSSDVLEHVTNVRSFVNNIYRHLRIGGKAVINFPNEVNHGINHFQQANDLRKLFAGFDDIRIFIVDIKHPVNQLWLSVRAFYESLLSRSTREAREQLYSGRQEQGIDRFEDSTCFMFVSARGKISNSMASIFAETCLLIKPTIDVRQVQRADENILNSPRLVVVATK
jgi:SAM-dependent methyltransferase